MKDLELTGDKVVVEPQDGASDSSSTDSGGSSTIGDESKKDSRSKKDVVTPVSDMRGKESRTPNSPAKLSRQRTSRKANASARKLEDQMNFEHLKKLEEIFQGADEDGGGGLDIDEFRAAMKCTMGSEVDDKELELIFMKVDTNCDGTVDWDEYLSYMLLEYQEKDTMTSLIKEVPFPKKMKEVHSVHRDCVVRIAFLQHLTNRHGNKALDRDNPCGKFISLSKEGQLAMYGTDFEFQKSITIDSGRESFVGQWMTDMVTLANVGMIAISSSEREISFYDVSANKFDKQFQITGLKDIILSMDYWFDHYDLNRCTLIAGDATGSVIVLRFANATSKGLFGILPKKFIVKKIPFTLLVRHKLKSVRGMIFEEIHSNWINRVRYYTLAQGSECFISCSSSDSESMYLGDLSNITYKPKWPGYTKTFSSKSTYFRVRKGILAFDYCKDWNIIVTGSFDGAVRTWNPYSSKPGSVIKGHLSPVEHVIIVSSSGQVITAGRDRTIRIMELRDHLTTQVLGPRSFLRLSPKTHPFQAMLYHGRTESLWVAAIQVGVLEGYDDRVNEDQMNVKSHDGPVSAVFYNPLFNQVVTGGHDSIVSVWDLSTGVKVIQFYTVKGVELTAMTFDPSGRRLITGSRNGAVKIWNFNNGACLRTLVEETNLEVTGIVCLKQKIITAGWNKVPVVYLDAKSDDDDDRHQWAAVHEDDILCMAQYWNGNGPAIVASASYDGNVFVWSVDTGHVLCRLNKLEAYSPMSIDGHKMAASRRRDTARPSVEKSLSDQSTTSFDSTPVLQRRKAVFRASSIKLPYLKTPDSEAPDTISPGEADADLANDESRASITRTRKSVLSDGSRSSTPKIVKFEMSGNLTPSARSRLGSSARLISDRKISTRERKTRHQVDVVTGRNNRNYWETEVSIDKLLFLQNRPHEPQTATLLAAGALGWVYAWSVHPQGGLLGQFFGAQQDGDSVFSMATDNDNKLLMTGDTCGYVKAWDIASYCLKKRRHSRLKEMTKPIFKADQNKMRILSFRRKMKLNLVPPELSFYFRAHLGSVTDITIIDGQELFLTGSGDGTVRLWTLTGQYIGTFGQKQLWDIEKHALTGKMPSDIKRIASSNTLKVLHKGNSNWKLARNTLNFINTGATESSSFTQCGEDDAAKENFNKMYVQVVEREEEKTDDEIERRYQKSLEKLRNSEVLGRSYRSKRRHRRLPKIDVKTHLNNYHVHSAIPFAKLEDVEPISVPDILQEKWRMHKAEDYDRHRFGRAYGKRRKAVKSQVTFMKTSHKIVKAVKFIRAAK